MTNPTRADMRARRSLSPSIRLRDLTPRERAVLMLRCGDEELTVPETGRALSINSQTVKNHSISIIRKFGVYSFNGVCRVYGQVTESEVDAMKAYEV